MNNPLQNIVDTLTGAPRATLAAGPKGKVYRIEGYVPEAVKKQRPPAPPRPPAPRWQ